MGKISKIAFSKYENEKAFKMLELCYDIGVEKGKDLKGGLKRCLTIEKQKLYI